MRSQLRLLFALILSLSASTAYAVDLELEKLACPGFVTHAVKVTVPPEYENLKPFYEKHFSSALRMFDGWKLPRDIEIRFGEVESDAVAEPTTGIAYSPVLFSKFKSGKVTNPRATLALALHEFGHLAATSHIGEFSPLWKKVSGLPAEIETTNRLYDELSEQNSWFWPGNDYDDDLGKRRIARVMQVLFDHQQILFDRKLQYQKFFSYGSIAYQEIFSDFVSVLYLEDAAIMKKTLGGAGYAESLTQSRFRRFDGRYSPVEKAKWLAAIRTEFDNNSDASDGIVHMTFAPARAEIGAIVSSRVRTLSGKRKALDALARAIGSETERIGLDFFKSPDEIDFEKWNDGLVAAFQRIWSAGD